jgi:hypothetical protein
VNFGQCRYNFSEETEVFSEQTLGIYLLDTNYYLASDLATIFIMRASASSSCTYCTSEPFHDERGGVTN